MKVQGEIVTISGHLGFVRLPDNTKISFDIGPDFNLLVGDIVEFDVREIAVSKSGSSYVKAYDLELIARPEIVIQPSQIRLSKIARQFNLGISALVKILERHNIKVESNPNAKITQEQFALVLGSLTGIEELDDSIQERIKFQEKYQLGSVVDVRVSEVIPPSQIITLFPDGFIGRLSMIDLAWSVPQAEILFSNIKVHHIISCQIIDVDFESKQVKLSIKHKEKQGSDTMLWARIDRGDVLSAQITEELASSYLVHTDEGFYGLISKEYPIDDPSEKIKVKVQDKLDDIDLLRVLPASLEIKEDLPQPVIKTNDFGFIEKELRSFQAFKKSILGTHATDNDLQLLNGYFINNENLFSKEIEAPFTWHISFEAKSSVYETTLKQNAIPYFLDGKTYSTETENELLEKLSKSGYWVRVNQRRGKADEIEFSLFNEETNFHGNVIISKDQRLFKCIIRNFSFGHTLSGASEAKKRNSKYGAYFLRSPIIITPPNSILASDESNKQVIDFILEKAKAFEIVSKLKQEAGEILREEGRTLGLIDKFLEYQESLLDQNKGIPVFVDKYSRINSQSGTVAVLVNQHVGNSLEIEEESVVNVKVAEGTGPESELKWFSDAALSYEGDQCRLTFYRDVSLTNLNKGFYVELKVSKAQLQIQRSIIQDFLHKKIKIDHIESLLVQPDKIKPPVVSTVELLNKDLVATERDQPDNNQIKAVRKAIGNSNIFLIQGPPGTGKTTVIAEIINQLVKAGKRILVTGQNHVAVDNVLDKISDNPELNLLRVGREDKIDKDLNQYHIDNLVKEYQASFNLFLKNQVELIKFYIELVNQDKRRDEILPLYNKKVNDCIQDYSNLKEPLKQRHYLLRDGISSLAKEELNQTLVAFENWINSINNEIDLLIQPLIYNSVDVVFATCIGIKTDSVFRDSALRFDTVIIDEAGKANIAETLVAIELGKEVILVGDQKQLPPYMDSTQIDPKDPKSFPKSQFGHEYLQDEIIHALKTSFFEFLIRKIDKGEFPKENLEMLNYQHRMHPNIGKFVSESFYGGKVMMGSKTHQNRLELPSPLNKEVVFFDTSNTPNPYELVEETSVKNNTEAEVITDIVLPLLFDNHMPDSEIAIIAPYKSQVANIKSFISNSEKCKNKNIDVSTLDSFQGKEYDVIIFSFTRSSNHDQSYKAGRKPVKVGFLDDAKRLNVAFSRARKKLILIGNAKTLTDKRSHFDMLFNYTELFSRLVKLSQDEAIGNVVNVADDKDFKSPFDRLIEKYKVGDEAEAKFAFSGKKNGELYGYFFKIEGYMCLLPLKLIPKQQLDSYSSLQPESVTKVQIIEINNETKKVKVSGFLGKKFVSKADKDALWKKHIAPLQKGNKVKGKVVEKKDFGYFVRLDCGIQGLLHNSKIKRGKTITVEQEIHVKILFIDNERRQLSLGYF